ncbi:MAG: hypothetical protein ABI488_13675 [Polyangiaceae bacterium]
MQSGGLFLAVCGALAYLATDVGIWLTESAQTEGGQTEYPLDEARATGLWQSLKSLADARQYGDLAAQVQALPGLTVASRRKLEAQESGCPKCGQVAMQVSLHQPSKEGWTTTGERLTGEGGPTDRASLVA